MLSLAEKMALWANKEGVSEETREGLFEGVGADEDDKLDPAESSNYRKILIGSSRYEWLMSTLRRELRSANAISPDLAIRNRILEILPCGEVSRHRPPRSYDIIFELSWDILAGAGLASKFSDDEISVDDGCGSGSITVLHYAQDRWSSSGMPLLFLLDDLIQHRAVVSRCSRAFPPGSKHIISDLAVTIVLTLSSVPQVRQNYQPGSQTKP